jgi:hypothetical protein
VKFGRGVNILGFLLLVFREGRGIFVGEFLYLGALWL